MVRTASHRFPTGSVASITSEADRERRVGGGSGRSRPSPVIEVDGLGVIIGPGCHQCADARGRRCAACATTWALEDVSCDVLPGEIVGVLGPSGSGKSTLLAAMAGRRIPDEGEIRIARGSTEDATDAPLVFTLQPEAVALGIRYARAADEELIRRLIPQSSEPALLLFDDPTIGRDASVQASFVELVHRIACSGSWSVVVASSDARVVRTLSDRVLMLRDGRVKGFGLSDALLGTEGTVPW